MIFFCFSSKDRHTIVDAILFHITKYEIPVWYDRQQMLLGDDRNHKNFTEGVEKASYFIIVLSPNSIASTCANEEIDLIKNKCNKEHTVIFPLFYNITANNIPEKYSWMKQLVYKEIYSDVDVYSACNHIICKILYDELTKYKIQSFKEFCNEYQNVPSQHYITEMLYNYRAIDNSNYNSKISIIYSLYIFIKSTYNITSIPAYYYAGMDRLFDDIKLNLKTDLREMIIMERSLLLLLNTIFFGYVT
ncbi:MAG: toll/interleukin-1 receptor domain-containing protein [Lachnospiraceae bacterium]|nr:toll/interleukin-1 receptor domain-containing protein [Lachnospiraceae bacterium]